MLKKQAPWHRVGRRTGSRPNSPWRIVCPSLSVVPSHVGSSGESERSDIPFGRVSTTTHPNLPGIPIAEMEKDGCSQSLIRIARHAPHAAAIDIGSASHFVAVPPDRDEGPVREFHTFTAPDLEALVQWLKDCAVAVVAMESPGGVLDSIPLYELLEALGFTGHLVNARHVKNVGSQVRCARLPVAVAIDELRPAERSLPTSGGDLRTARGLAPARPASALPEPACPAPASTCRRRWRR